ncbi:carboxypeptidase regulatory-like domain-containing protein [Acinetobacter johnsonii]|uniref:carboxypeptidase regulatory-like domain-containing protein n=1 Tax=Acinetobacter johnsonii TaxID=40214 RepID=UPI000F684137|nr:carboxypeptidase regulatory-like domain-containing protein [Acinetobacter johnsonii]QYA56412.1 carboxypeptidase regulatory-like domain-containing protein [Acinetobacter johnsonii]
MRLNASVKVNPQSNETLYDFTNQRAIKGSVSKKNIRIPCIVRLYEKSSGRLVKEVIADKNGNYTFNQLVKIKYFIVAFDPSSQFNAVIQDNVVPK